MISTGLGKSAGAPPARRLALAGSWTALALSGATTVLLWTIFFLLGDTGIVAVGALIAGHVAAIGAGWTLQHILRTQAARERAALRDAGHDLLSGLANRALFTEWVEYELARHRREGVHFALHYIDIDHFKDINDRHGHDAGDRMIAAVAKRISHTLRPTDRLARFGGDEFAILQTGVRTMRDAEALASRIVEAMRAAFDLGGLEILSSVSIGIALCPDNADEREDLMKLADLALYRAKNKGRDGFAFFDSRMGEEVARRRALSRELAEAIEADALRLHYSPVGAGETLRLASAQARLLWPHPQRGLLTSRDFMGVAEDHGLSLALGDWLLRRACADAAAWKDMRVGIAVSPVQFANRDFAAHVLDTLRTTGLESARLDIMLHEASILSPKDNAVSGMKRLRDEGVRFTLTGWGSGVASLNYIRRFPFTRIRIDAALTNLSPRVPENEAILRAAIDLARSIGMIITADGVASEDQARALLALGCDELQGEFISRQLGGELAQLAGASAT